MFRVGKLQRTIYSSLSPFWVKKKKKKKALLSKVMKALEKVWKDSR